MIRHVFFKQRCKTCRCYFCNIDCIEYFDENIRCRADTDGTGLCACMQEATEEKRSYNVCKYYIKEKMFRTKYKE